MITGEALRPVALDYGLDVIGIAPPVIPFHDRRRLHEFIASGSHGTMTWMTNHPERRVDPKMLWPPVQSVIVAGVNYAPADCTASNVSEDYISAYVGKKDYHDIIKKRLKKFARWLTDRYGGDFRIFVDTAPVLERALAVQAGIGWQGKSTQLISRQFGPWLFLGEIFTTLMIQTDTPARNRCGTCTRCITACPVQAISKPFQLDVKRCISYLTIEHNGRIPISLRPRMGVRIYGCDACLRSCPWNRFARPTEDPNWILGRLPIKQRIEDLLNMTDASFRLLFKGSPIKRIGVDRFLRNVLIAAANLNDPTFIGNVEQLSNHDSNIVRETARWAYSELAAIKSSSNTSLGSMAIS